jgi:hypothetical protein
VVPLLAVTVEVTASSVTALDAVAIEAPQPQESAIPQLRVSTLRVDDDGAPIFSYTVPDPRFVEIDDEQHQVLPKVKTIFYAAIAVEADRLRIAPEVTGQAEPDDTEPQVSTGGEIPLKPLLLSACRRVPSMAACRAVIEHHSKP